MQMKKLAIAAGLAILSAGSSFAADMAVKARPVAAPVVVTNWTGCYIGGGGGYGMYNQKREVVAPYGNQAVTGNNGVSSYAQALTAPAGALIYPNETFGGEGWLATVQGGCDYQFAGSNFLIGAFADADWTDIKGDRSLLGVLRGSQTLNWSWAVGGRLGWLVTPSLLTYVSGGYTQADFKKTGRLGCSTCYLTFAEGLGSLLKAMHKGTEHVGKLPQRAHRAMELNDKMRELTQNLERAVAEENYETAASLRDEIKKLEAKIVS